MKNLIECDVTSCIFNKLGTECTLCGVKITKDHNDFTFCGSFKQKLSD